MRAQVLWMLCCALVATTAATASRQALGNPIDAREPPSTELAALPETELPKKLRERAGKQSTEDRNAQARQRWHKALDRLIGKRAAPVVNIYNTWTHEFLPIDVRVRDELPDADKANDFLRCHFTNQPADMDPRLFATLVAAARHFGVRRVDIVSGFRSPKYNLILRKKGREVARSSQHTLGHAVDFRLPGVSVKRVHAWARGLRLGGVGFYPSSGFIHVDTGPVRYWNGR